MGRATGWAVAAAHPEIRLEHRKILVLMRTCMIYALFHLGLVLILSLFSTGFVIVHLT
jgi:hypothetical protein